MKLGGISPAHAPMADTALGLRWEAHESLYRSHRELPISRR